MSADLHRGFAAPAAPETDRLAEFLHRVDQLPGMADIHRGLREAAGLDSATHLVDVGCGIGIETRRIAADYPNLRVTGADHNPAMLTAADAAPMPNLEWLEGELTNLDLPPGSVDVVRTERVLMYVADLAKSVCSLWNLLRPGGRLVCFELDYGATILRQAGHDEALLDELTRAMREALPQPLAARHLPALAEDLGAAEVRTTPLSFAVTPAVWERIVAATVEDSLRRGRLPAEPTRAWLARHRALPTGSFHAAFTGLLTAATAPR